jgi:peptide-methionine (R)-S-oxide reductase
MKIIYILLVAVLLSCSSNTEQISKKKSKGENMEFPVYKPDSVWNEELSDIEYQVLRNKGTERPYTGKYNDHFEPGVYVCKGCGEELFTATTKFESHCGWPSFYDAIDKKNIKEVPDYSHGMVRTEVVCANCGGHLGHVFDDGPNPTGLRYCINSVSLGFISEDEYKKEVEEKSID